MVEKVANVFQKSKIQILKVILANLSHTVPGRVCGENLVKVPIKDGSMLDLQLLVRSMDVVPDRHLTQVSQKFSTGFLRGIGNKADCDITALRPVHGLECAGNKCVAVVEHSTEVQ